MIELIQNRAEKVIPALKEELGVKNRFAVPRIVKVVINSGTGKAKDKKRNELVADRLTKITGQKVAARGAKKSIASFKVRQGDVVGYSVTLRGKRMYDFLNRLFNIVFPRIRDFKGFTIDSLDEVGNLTIGLLMKISEMFLVFRSRL